MSVTFNNDSKFDIQLSQALVDERRLADVFGSQKLEKIELKSEAYTWRRTGNVCIEFECNGKPSGIAATEADMWFHELKSDDRSETYAYLALPVKRLKTLCREAYRRGNWKSGIGDDGKVSAVLLKIEDLLQIIH
jgi:hypothetical protein